jgi:hypothetical protein
LQRSTQGYSEHAYVGSAGDIEHYTKTPAEKKRDKRRKAAKQQRKSRRSNR